MNKKINLKTFLVVKYSLTYCKSIGYAKHGIYNSIFKGNHNGTGQYGCRIIGIYNSIFKGNHNGLDVMSINGTGIYNSIFKGNHNIS